MFVWVAVFIHISSRCVFHSQLRVLGGEQDRVLGLGRSHRRGVPGESDHQLGRNTVGQSTGGVMGRATGAGPNIPNGGAANHVFGVQGQ